LAANHLKDTKKIQLVLEAETGLPVAPASRFAGLTALSGAEGQPVKPCGWKPQPLNQA
jgi:hypothetical protein